MDIRIDRQGLAQENQFTSYANNKLRRYFDQYPFMQSVQLYLRGTKHPVKKVKLNARLKGKEIYAEAKAVLHHDALENALLKLETQLKRYKNKRYAAA